MLSANMHIAESRTLISWLYAGDETTDGIDSDVQDPGRSGSISLAT